MSEMINNRAYRQKILKELITELHLGKTVEDIKPRFEALIQGISPAEISDMEQSLIMDGMPVEEIQRLCDVHAEVFKGSIEDIHKSQAVQDIPGHPINTFWMENRAVEKLIHERIEPHLELLGTSDEDKNINLIKEDYLDLIEIDKHYSRKENLIFPYMEKYGITAPPKVMWGVDDEIRAGIKQVNHLLNNYKGNKDELLTLAREAIHKIIEMIFKEENILFPMVIETLGEDDWYTIAQESTEIGYSFIEPRDEWKPVNVSIEEKVRDNGQNPVNHGTIQFETGFLSREEINGVLNTLPLDITFVDSEGSVKYFSQGKERIFARAKTIIGRQVQNCHPPASVHIVEKIVEDLKSGLKDHEDFWIKMGDKFIYIRYFAVRDEIGKYLGTMEVTQDIKPIQALEGEKRLLSE